MKNYLGLDLGTNSIGWAFVQKDEITGHGKILGIGSRIIPTDTELLSKFETGQAASKNAKRRQFRGSRRLRSRYKLRRTRLIKAMQLLGWISADFKPGSIMPLHASRINEMKEAFGLEDVPDDWIVYYLRHIGLSEKLDKTEIARIVYHMNQRRGFKSNRKSDQRIASQDEGDEDEGRKKREKKIERVTVNEVHNTGEFSKGNQIFEIRLKDGRKGTTLRKIQPDWINKSLELEITKIPPTKKEPFEKLEFRQLSNSDQDQWAKEKVARQSDIDESGLKYPGTYYFHKLKEEALKGSVYIIKDVTIDRSYYEKELEAILIKQVELDPHLEDRHQLDVIAEIFYPKNEQKQKELKANGLVHLLVRDIVYFQRPLKSKKSSISDCRFELKNQIDPSTGKRFTTKVAPASSPVYQEFRIWQTLSNLRILQRNYINENGKTEFEKDVSQQFISPETLERLFDLFDQREKVRQKDILALLQLDPKDYLINLFVFNEEKELPGNETKAVLRKFFRKADLKELGAAILSDSEKLFKLWHLLYSVDDRKHIQRTLEKWYGISETSADILSTIPAFKPAYAALSSKAMNRLLPLMRVGKYWSWTSVSTQTQHRLEKIFNGEFDADITDQVRDLFLKHQLNAPEKCQGLNTPMAAYAVYGVHAERQTECYTNPEQTVPMEPLNLRNPIVEQVVNETLRLVRDVWKTLGRPFEIHIELARELKKNRKEREAMTKAMGDNEQENKRISAILRELNLGNPNSMSDIEKLKLWERQAGDDARNSLQEIKFKRPEEPTDAEIERYKLWAQQQFISPYSGQPIPLSKLFSRQYDIDHIIPRSRLFDDSLDNKVVVESNLNSEKGNMTAMEYIKRGSTMGYPLMNTSEYEQHVLRFFSRKKKKMLLSEDVPEHFINRQLVDTRYIGRKVSELLSPVSENQKDPIIVSNGTITHELKANWGLGEVMKELVKWRFERLSEITGEEFCRYEQELGIDGKLTGRRILRLKGFEKRIDHRHHALDALVVACTTRSHVKYLNDLNRSRPGRQGENDDLRASLPLLLEKSNDDRLQARKFKLPWESFRKDASSVLSNTMVSFRNRIRIFGKKANRYSTYVKQDDGQYRKKTIVARNPEGQIKMAPYVRQSLHKATIFGQLQKKEYKEVPIGEAFKHLELIAEKAQKLYLRQLLAKSQGDILKAVKAYKKNPFKNKDGQELGKIVIATLQSYATSRVDLSSGFDSKRIEKIPDSILQEKLHEHLREISLENKDRPKDSQIEPFGQEGMQMLNADGKFPIKKVTTIEDIGSKFQIRPGAYTEADKGTNLYFVIYENIEDPSDRQFASIPLRHVVEAKIAGENFVEEKPGYKWFLLSPNDLVYLPDEGEKIDFSNDTVDPMKVYRMASSTKGVCYFVHNSVSKAILDKVEFGPLNKSEKSMDGRMIKQFCKKISCNRLGYLTE